MELSHMAHVCKMQMQHDTTPQKMAWQFLNKVNYIFTLKKLNMFTQKKILYTNLYSFFRDFQKLATQMSFNR